MAKKTNRASNRSPDKSNLRKQSNPKSEAKQLEAIKDDLNADIVSYLRSLYMEQAVFADTMKRTLGQGGDELGAFIKQLEKGFSDVSNRIEKTEKEDAPILKKISSEAVIESKLKDELKSDGENTKTKGRQPKSK